MIFRNVQLLRCIFNPSRRSATHYSRKNDSNQEKFYKLVVKVDNTVQQNNPLAPVPNWEILRPRGYRFFLPGNIGPGWHDLRSNAHTLALKNQVRNTAFKFYAQECPVLIRKNVLELFPGVDFSYSQLSILTLNHKKVREDKVEGVIKTFVLIAQDVSQKLRSAGFWADFINPFSGLPSVNKYNIKDCYSTDPQFGSMGLNISSRNNCCIIEEKSNRSFTGYVFTTAPADADILRDLLAQNDELFE